MGMFLNSMVPYEEYKKIAATRRRKTPLSRYEVKIMRFA